MFYRIWASLARRTELRFLPDKLYLKWVYRGNTLNKLDLKKPQRYTEILQWMKIYDQNPIYTTMVDKFAAKSWAGNLIGSNHIIKTLGVWTSAEEIDIENLPKQFVLKCTHDSKSVLICKDKDQFDWNEAKKKLTKALKRKYYYEGRQWPYKNVVPKIIAEEYIINHTTQDLRDYKFFTFNGEPKVMYIATGRGTGEVYGDFFDMDFNHLDLMIDHKMAPTCPEKPVNFEKMKEACKVLAKNTPQVRVDFYEANGQFYFGEMTFFHCNGFIKFTPDIWDEKFGSWIDINNTVKKKNL